MTTAGDRTGLASRAIDHDPNPPTGAKVIWPDVVTPHLAPLSTLPPNPDLPSVFPRRPPRPVLPRVRGWLLKEDAHTGAFM
jgi:hypothetical protein